LRRFTSRADSPFISDLRPKAWREMRIHYQTLEAVGEGELRALRAIKEGFNEGKGFEERIKLWRKDDILTCLQPAGARWGFSEVHDGGKQEVLQALERMSEATPRLTWLVFDEGRREELVLRGGKRVA